MEFDFPMPPINRFERCESVIQLRQIVRLELTDVGLQRKCRYSIHHTTQRFIYAKCSRCTAFLRYQLYTSETGESWYRLKKYNTHHNHKHRGVQTKRQLTIEMLRNLPPDVQPASLRTHIINTLKISRYTFYSALRQIEGNNRGINFKTLLPYLQEKGYVVFEPFPIERVVFFPQFCLCITQNMKQTYLKYGRFIGIDFTYNLIRQVPYQAPEQENPDQKKKKKLKQWITGVISGLDSARRLLIYGIAFCYSQSSDSIQKILDNFFQIMGRTCETIISDGGLGIEEAVRRLQSRRVFMGSHLLDAYHVMANLKVKYDHMEVLRKLYLAADEQEYYKIFQHEIVYMDGNQQRKFGKFDSLAHRFCISKIPVTFVALGSSTSMSQKINDLIKTAIPRETSFSEVMTKIIRLSEKINSEQPAVTYQSYPFESVIQVPWLKDLRSVLNKYVFRRLLRQVFKSSYLEYNECREICNLEDSKVNCECKFQEKTGLPCKHIIKILLMHGKPLARQIDEYWILSGQEDINNRRKAMLAQGHRRIKAGRPRNSRRNMKK